jgi:hypothetical protein
MAGITPLIEANRPRLGDMLGAAPFTLVEVDEGHCRVMTDRLTIHFYRRPGEGAIHSSLELGSVPAHAVPFTNHLHTWLVLRSRGEEWPEPQSESLDPAQLAAELDRVERAIPIVRDETSLRETLLWEAGYMDGYASWD